MKSKIKNIIIILLVILSILILSFFTYNFIKSKILKDNINTIYNIYNDTNRNNIINEHTNDNHLFGIPITSSEDSSTILNAIGTLEIPSINFKDIVLEGTSQNALSQGIGLFENSSILNGNVCVAGHNTSRFLAKLKNVKQGDIINYSSCLGNKKYVVTTIKKIEETDWSMLEDTKNNKITIITCVKGQKNLRLCVQGIEKI